MVGAVKTDDGESPVDVGLARPASVGLIEKHFGWRQWFQRRLQLRNSALLSVPAVMRDADLLVIPHLVVVLVMTWVCVNYEYHCDGQLLTFLGLPLFFAIGFSINEAYNRRQEVLACLAELQGHMWGVHRFFQRAAAHNSERASFGSAEFVGDTSLLFVRIRTFCTQKRVMNGRNLDLEEIYRIFRKLAAMLNDAVELTAGDAAPANEMVGSSLLTQAITTFEKIRCLRDYKTPRSARHWYKVMLGLIPILLTPVYAETARGNEWSAYYQATVVTIVLSSLGTVQNVLDNCFNTLQFLPSGRRITVREHTDCIDLAKLEYWPLVAITGTLSDRDAQCTYAGGPTRTMTIPLNAIGARLAAQRPVSADPPSSPLRELFKLASEKAPANEQLITPNVVQRFDVQTYSSETPDQVSLGIDETVDMGLESQLQAPREGVYLNAVSGNADENSMEDVDNAALSPQSLPIETECADEGVDNVITSSLVQPETGNVDTEPMVTDLDPSSNGLNDSTSPKHDTIASENEESITQTTGRFSVQTII